MAPRRDNLSQVERNIIDILEDRGYDRERDKVLFEQAHDYGDLWRVKELLLTDVHKRGVSIVQPSGVIKKNDSVGEMVRVSAQMLKILQFLKIEPFDVQVEQEEDESPDGL